MVNFLFSWFCGCVWLVLSLVAFYVLAISPEHGADVGFGGWFWLGVYWLGAGIGAFYRKKR